MPEDFRYAPSDLYKFMVRDGQFYVLKELSPLKNEGVDIVYDNIGNINYENNLRENEHQIDNVHQINNEHKINNENNIINGNEIDYQPNNIEELDLEMKNIAHSSVAKKLLLRYRRVAKKIDIKKLQENVLTTIDNHKIISMNDICKEIPQMYENNKKDVSVHYCILSMLFLANENNIKIDGDNGGIKMISSIKK